MANPTTNYGFVLPTPTDLVTDLPADFDVALQGVDTRLKALQPGTTLGDLAYSSATANTNTRLPVGTNGQVLAVVAGVPAWQNGTTGDIEGVTAGVGITGGGTSGTVTVTNDMATTITAAGDIVIGTGSGTYDNLPIGTTAQVLTADTTVSPYKVKWATPASPSTAKTFSLLNAGGTSLSGATTTISGISGIDQIMVIIGDCSTNTSNPNITVLLNSDSGSNYKQAGQDIITTTSTLAAKIDKKYNAANDSIQLGSTPAAADELNAGIMLFGCNTSGVKPFQTTVGISNVANANFYMLNGVYTGSSAITSISIKTSGGSFDKGTIFVYGAA
jgi:hypothetical protein